MNNCLRWSNYSKNRLTNTEVLLSNKLFHNNLWKIRVLFPYLRALLPFS